MGPLFPAGSRKLEYGGQTWHEHCFLCSGCEQPLGSRSFVPDKGAHYCVPCYENKFAPRCARCSKVGAGRGAPLHSGEGVSKAPLRGGNPHDPLPPLIEAAPTDTDAGWRDIP